jgi:predicted Rossmann-fold nucleotide-binding protein
VSVAYWGGLIEWIKEVMLKQEGNINPEDMELFTIVDTAEEAVDVIDKFYSKYLLSPNF